MVSNLRLGMMSADDREELMFRVRKVLYATDFSSFSTQAYFHAVNLAEKWNASLVIVTVFDGKDSRSTLQKQLESIRPSNARIPVRHMLLEGDPAAEIVEYADRANIDVIVMGTRGRGGFEQVLGSVAEKVLKNAHCSVLVVKMPKGVAVSESHNVAMSA